MSAPDTALSLGAFADRARAAGKIALDTEFIGEGRYRALLCLIQLAVPALDDGGKLIEVFDPLDERFDGTPLATVLADPEVQVVVHAGRQDIALARRVLGTEVVNVFDTQVAAGFAGMSAQSSYESLLAEMLKVRVAKTASFTRWDLRPLSEEQIAYAREDVEHLLELAAELERRLRDLGRLGWACEECEVLQRTSDERDPDVIFERLPRLRGLSAAARTTARELVRWREQTAAREDRPVQSVLGDAALIEIAKRRPKSKGELEQIRGAAGANVRRRGSELLALVRRASELPPDEAPVLARTTPPRAADVPLIALGEALLRARALDANVAYELLASRADLQAIVGAWRTGEQEADVRTLRGWRRELAGGELLELLDGAISMSVERDRLRIDERHTR